MSEKILFIVPYVPNLIRVRPFNLIRYLAQRGHEITLLTLWSNEDERQSLSQLEPYVHNLTALRLPRWRSLWNVLATLPTGKPLQTAFCWQPGLAREIDRLFPQQGRPLFDVVHVEHLRGAPFGLYLKSLQKNGRSIPPVIWDSVDSISLLFRQAMQHSRSRLSRNISRFELGRTEAYEGWLVSQFDHATVTSAADRNALVELMPPGSNLPKISVIPNGVDLDYFQPDPGISRHPDKLVITGKMSYHANATMVMHFVHDILPLIWQHRPQTRLVVVGKDPGREILALSEDERIQVTGTVSHLPPYMQEAAVAVAPLKYGAGIQNKVLEAMACAAPVVTTPQVVNALQAVPGKDLMVASSPDQFARHVLDLLDNRQRQQEIGSAGRAYVETHHHWRKAVENLERVYEQAAGEWRKSDKPGKIFSAARSRAMPLARGGNEGQDSRKVIN